MNNVQSIIKSLRKEGLTQTEIARKIRAPQARISRWESGDVPRSADDALALNQLLVNVLNPPQTEAT